MINQRCFHHQDLIPGTYCIVYYITVGMCSFVKFIMDWVYWIIYNQQRKKPKVFFIYCWVFAQNIVNIVADFLLRYLKSKTKILIYWLTDFLGYFDCKKVWMNILPSIMTFMYSCNLESSIILFTVQFKKKNTHHND